MIKVNVLEDELSEKHSELKVKNKELKMLKMHNKELEETSIKRKNMDNETIQKVYGCMLVLIL